MNFNWYTKKNIYYKIALNTAIICFISASVVFYFFLAYTNDKRESTKKNTEYRAKLTAQRLDSVFQRVIKIADTLANDIATGKLNNQNLKPTLVKHLDYRNKLFGIGVAFVPNTSSPDIRTFSPYYASIDSVKKIERSDLIKVYSSPIFRIDSATNNKLVTGYVYVDFLVTDIKTLMDSLKLERSGYGFLLSQNGTFIAHPVNEYNMNEGNKSAKTIFEISIERDDNQYYKLGELTVMRAESGVLEHKNEITGQDSWMFYQAIPSIDWSLIVVFVIDEIPIRKNVLRNFLLTISLLIVLGGLGVLTVGTKAYTGGVSRLVMLSVLYSALLFFEIAFVWYLTLKYDIKEDEGAVRIVDKTGLDNIKNIYGRDVRNKCKEEPIYVPTGIFIESMEFPTSSNVMLSGYLWQKYDAFAQSMVEEGDRGVIFPEAVDDEMRKTFHFQSKEQNYLLYGWYFQIVVKKSFDFAKYPLDKKDLMVRIVPRNFEKNIVLTPDLDAYKYINPRMLPGLRRDLVVQNWDIITSNFIYKTNQYNTNFGIEHFDCKDKAPELYFDVNLTRNFVGAIISSLLPMLVMLSVLFILITIATRNIDLVTRVLSPIGSFFFAILLAHVSLRRDLVVENMVYFEYIYIAMYFMILLIFIDTVMYSRDTDRFFFHYKKNLITKLLFWPVFSLILLVLSIYLLVIK